MKKAIILTAAIVMISLPALALTDTEIMAAGHDLNRGIVHASELPAIPEIEGTSSTYKVTENIHVVFIEKEGQAKTCSCVCLSESELSEFLAQCVTICLNYGDPSYTDQYYAAVLSHFLETRSDEEPQTAYLPGLIFKLTKEKFGYVFILTRAQ